MKNKAVTKQGVAVGVREGSSVIYKGVPYAAPPIGRLRFAAPEAPESWEGERICDRWANDSYKVPFPPVGKSMVNYKVDEVYSEDCLYLNIWAPADIEDDAGLPVMFFLYGAGGGNHAAYIDGAAFNEKGCILITVNYRIGLFGFFGLDELAAKDAHGSTGNYGLMDILCALDWVRDNIAAFGGDPENITVFGHSAGGIYTKWLLGCSMARGKFRHAISLSGGGIWDIDYVHTKESKCRLCRQLLDMAGWTFEDVMSRSTEEVYAVLTSLERSLPLPQKSMMNTLFLPSIDDWIVHDYHGKILYDGDVDENADVMCGMLVEEWRNHNCQIPGGIGGYGREFALASVISWGDRFNQRGIKPVYTYFFDRHMPGPDGRSMIHGDELAYVFGTLDRYIWPWTDFDRKMSSAVISYFTNFAKTGDPNGEGLPAWKPYEADTHLTMHFAEDHFAAEDISDDSKTRETVDFLMERPGMLDDPFPPAMESK